MEFEYQSDGVHAQSPGEVSLELAGKFRALGAFSGLFWAFLGHFRSVLGHFWVILVWLSSVVPVVVPGEKL